MFQNFENQNLSGKSFVGEDLQFNKGALCSSTVKGIPDGDWDDGRDEDEDEIDD